MLHRLRLVRALLLACGLAVLGACGDEQSSKRTSLDADSPKQVEPGPGDARPDAAPQRKDAPAELAPDPDALDLNGFLTKIGSDDAEDREWAVYRLGVDFEDEDLRKARTRLEPVLIRALEDASADVRRGAVAGLARMGGSHETLLEAVAQLLSDPAVRVRAQTADALGRWGKAAAAWGPALVRKLEDDAAVVRHNAAHALASIGFAHASVETSLVRLLGTDPDDEVRVQSALTLGELNAKSPAVASALLAALDDPHGEVRAAAIWALGHLRLEREKARPLIEVLLRDDNPEVREAAQQALDRLK